MNLSLKSKPLIEFTKEEIILILREFLNEQKELTQRKMIDEDSFNKPSWPEYQAFQLGILKAINKIESFIPDQEGI